MPRQELEYPTQPFSTVKRLNDRGVCASSIYLVYPSRVGDPFLTIHQAIMSSKPSTA
jgi:hypothetical protein